MSETRASTEDTLAEVLSEGRAGRAVAVVGSGGPAEARAVLALMAQFVTPESLEALLAYGEGEPMLAMEASRWERLGRPAPRSRADPEALTASIQGAIAAGIDARYPDVEELPIAFRTCADGVLERPEPEEGAVDVGRLAGLQPAAVICPFEIADTRTSEDGKIVFPDGTRVPYVTVNDLLRHRMARVIELERAVTVGLPTPYGDFTMVGYDASVQLIGAPVALVKGDVEGAEEVPLYVHRSCVFGDALYSRACDCAERIRTALARLGVGGKGVVVRLTAATLDPCDPDAALDELDRTVVSGVLAELGIRSTVPILK